MTDRPKRILIVDDEPDLVDMLKMYFENEGFEVFTAYDGQEGLDVAQENAPDIIILDVMMPKMDGFQVARLLKFDKKLAHIPIIILTARSHSRDRETANVVKADAYVTKPFQYEALLAVVNQFFPRPQV